MTLIVFSITFLGVGRATIYLHTNKIVKDVILVVFRWRLGRVDLVTNKTAQKKNKESKSHDKESHK